jgi:hypothetical protein
LAERLKARGAKLDSWEKGEVLVASEKVPKRAAEMSHGSLGWMKSTKREMKGKGELGDARPFELA